MNLNKFTEKAQEALMESQNLAQRNGQVAVEPEHLLKNLAEQDPGLALSILRKAGIAVDGLVRRIDQVVEQLPKVSGGGSAGMARRLSDICLKAEDEAKKFKDDYVSVEHLLLALVEDSGMAGRTPVR